MHVEALFALLFEFFQIPYIGVVEDKESKIQPKSGQTVIIKGLNTPRQFRKWLKRMMIKTL